MILCFSKTTGTEKTERKIAVGAESWQTKVTANSERSGCYGGGFEKAKESTSYFGKGNPSITLWWVLYRLLKKNVF